MEPSFPYKGGRFFFFVRAVWLLCNKYRLHHVAGKQLSVLFVPMICYENKKVNLN